MRAVSRSLALVATAVILATGCGGADDEPRRSGSGTTSAGTTSTAASQSLLAGARGWLAYQSFGANGSDGVFLVRTDGSNDHEILTDLPGNRAHPDFSRDGKRLAVDQLTDEESPSHVYVANADGAHARRVPPCLLPKCAGHSQPAWSPDGRRLAVVTDIDVRPLQPPKRFGIAVIDLAKGTERPVVENPNTTGQNLFPRWSPDGRRLVFWRDRERAGGFETAVFVVNVNGSGLRRLTPWGLLAGDPDWSPDGSRILFNTRPLFEFSDAGQSELHTIRPDGTGMRRLTNYGHNGPRATQPRWTPDGKAILYTRTTQTGRPRHIYAINADGTEDTPVLTAKPIYTHPVLQPTP